MKVIFMGTPSFAVPILEEILKKHEVTLVVTQPDTYNHKKKAMVFSEVKEKAIEKNIEVFQPDKIRLDYSKVINTPCDVIVTAAYGQIIPKVLLDYPKYKAINIHGSLLPKYRGGAPIQRSIINGDSETGITIMYMAEKMDSGEIIEQRKIEIADNDISDTLFEKLSMLGAEMINPVLSSLEKGAITSYPQDESKVTFAYNLKKEEEKIDFSKTAKEVFNQIRGLNSNPGAYFTIDGIIYKVFASEVSLQRTNKEVGTIVDVSKKSFGIACNGGTVINILQIKPESKKLMSVCDFLNGNGKNITKIDKKVD